MERKKIMMWRYINALSYACAVGVNALANVLPIAGVKTEDVAQRYANLFSPADYAFAIWGLIYALLAGFVIYQFTAKGRNVVQKCGAWFALSCLFNAVWMVLWHYDLIFWALLCMAGLLICLIMLNARLTNLTPVWQEKWLVGAGFHLYYGWVTVATMANVTVWLVQIGWRGFGIPPEIWTVAVLLLGVVVTALVLMHGGHATFGMAVIWGYAGILARHIMPSGFAMQHGVIIAASAVSLLLLAFMTIRSLLKGKIDNEKA